MSDHEMSITDIRAVLTLIFFFAAVVILLVYLFPSMRGPKWVDADLLLAVVFALLALVCKPR